MDSGRVAGGWHCVFYMRGEASGKPPDQTCWCLTVGVVSDYVAVQSKAVMLLSHLDRISPGRNACLCVCRRQSRHGNFDFIKADREGEELLVWRKCTTVFLACTCSPPHTPPFLACALLQYARECVKYENLMKPTGGAQLQYVMSFIL